MDHIDPEDELTDSRMPLLDHLIELRQRLIYSLAGFLLATALSYHFAGDIFDFLQRPLADVLGAGRQMQYTAVTEGFLTNIKLAMWAGFFLSFPIMAGQIWMFVAPGLYRSEKRAFLPFLVATPVLFVMGASLAYYVVMPLALRFFAGFEHTAGPDLLAVQLQPKISEYLSLVLTLVMAFGICFQLPVLLSLLVRVGLLTVQDLVSKRRYAIVAAFVLAAVLAPPDVVSMICLAVPLSLLYEGSIVVARLIERGRRKAAAGG